MTDKPNCYKCKHRRPLLGDVHSRCAHPKVAEAYDVNDPVNAIITLIATVGRGLVKEVDTVLNVTGNEHGIKNGWFAWPFNFDPTWLDTCNGWEER